MNGGAKLLSVLLALASAPVSADEGNDALAEVFHVGGSLRGGYFSASRKLDGAEDLGVASTWVKTSINPARDISFIAEGWARSEDVFRRGNVDSRMREAFLAVSAGGTDFRIGRQIIAWGRADEINPTDNLTPRDYTLLVPDTADQRLGADAILARNHSSLGVLTAIWMPGFDSNVVPFAPTPGVSFSHSQNSRHNQRAFKLERSGGKTDWSVSYFRGLDLNPVFNLMSQNPTGVHLALENNPIQVLGADASTTAGRFGLRMEAAYAWSASGQQANPYARKPNWYVVAGGDRTYFDHLNINLQYYFRRVAGYRDPRNIASPLVREIAVQGAVISNQLDRFQHGVSFRIANKWLDETLEGEISGIYSMTYRDFIIRPRMKYAFNDQWIGTIGADILRGDSDTFFGRLRDMSTVFAELRYSF